MEQYYKHVDSINLVFDTINVYSVATKIFNSLPLTAKNCERSEQTAGGLAQAAFGGFSAIKFKILFRTYINIFDAIEYIDFLERFLLANCCFCQFCSTLAFCKFMCLTCTLQQQQRRTVNQINEVENFRIFTRISVLFRIKWFILIFLKYLKVFSSLRSHPSFVHKSHALKLLFKFIFKNIQVLVK